jgi:Mrp family chromosome partitioning ATPase
VTDVLRNDAELDDVTVEVAVNLPAFDDLFAVDAVEVVARNGSGGHNGNGSHSDHIALLLGGAPPANPPAVLASTRLVDVLDTLRDRYDLVLIDSAPVLAVTDTVPILRYADAALFVGRLGVTTRETAKHLMEFLARVPDLNLLGVVANDLSRIESAGYGYGYGAYADPKPSRRRKAASAAPKQTV